MEFNRLRTQRRQEPGLWFTRERSSRSTDRGKISYKTAEEAKTFQAPSHGDDLGKPRKVLILDRGIDLQDPNCLICRKLKSYRSIITPQVVIAAFSASGAFSGVSQALLGSTKSMPSFLA